jgi:hypothetical protein
MEVFRRHESLGAFDAVLAATAMRREHITGNERGEQVCEALRQLRSILTAAPARPHVRELLQNLDRRGRGHPAVADRRDESAALADLLAPLVPVEAEDLERGMEVFRRHESLGAFDAVLAATAMRREVQRMPSSASKSLDAGSR